MIESSIYGRDIPEESWRNAAERVFWLHRVDIDSSSFFVRSCYRITTTNTPSNDRFYLFHEISILASQTTCIQKKTWKLILSLKLWMKTIVPIFSIVHSKIYWSILFSNSMNTLERWRRNSRDSRVNFNIFFFIVWPTITLFSLFFFFGALWKPQERTLGLLHSTSSGVDSITI